MTEPGTPSIILWDTLTLSAEPLLGRSGILVTAHVQVRKQGQTSPDEYRINFEINRHHGLVSHDTEVQVTAASRDGLRWRYSGRRDLVVAVKERFLTTQLYSHMARHLGWVPGPSVRLNHAPLEP
jgi:hypothetical protein